MIADAFAVAEPLLVGSDKGDLLQRPGHDPQGDGAVPERREAEHPDLDPPTTTPGHDRGDLVGVVGIDELLGEVVVVAAGSDETEHVPIAPHLDGGSGHDNDTDLNGPGGQLARLAAIHHQQPGGQPIGVARATSESIAARAAVATVDLHTRTAGPEHAGDDGPAAPAEDRLGGLFTAVRSGHQPARCVGHQRPAGRAVGPADDLHRLHRRQQVSALTTDLLGNEHGEQPGLAERRDDAVGQRASSFGGVGGATNVSGQVAGALERQTSRSRAGDCSAGRGGEVPLAVLRLGRGRRVDVGRQRPKCGNRGLLLRCVLERIPVVEPAGVLPGDLVDHVDRQGRRRRTRPSTPRATSARWSRSAGSRTPRPPCGRRCGRAAAGCWAR